MKIKFGYSIQHLQQLNCNHCLIKNFVFIILISMLIHINNCKSQNQSSFVKDNKKWNIYEFYKTTKEHHKTYQIKLKGDTIINEIKYFSVFLSTDLTKDEIWIRLGFIREDTTQKVFFLYNEQEFLLYDFSVKVGDTLEIYNTYRKKPGIPINEHCKLIVSEVDSVFIKKQRKRIILHQICSSSAKSVWIEGLGDLKGIFHSSLEYSICNDNDNRVVGHKMGGASYQLLCVYENDTLIYKNPKIDNCIIKNTFIR
ncbi:MAG: hypothetical protein JEY97_11785 [Bacteroidales bacterium]|nr:hypothetical protein [Bacteroidales bacterium]